MASVILLFASLTAGVTCAQFAPGCSFTDGRCMYNVQLGHQGQCDKRAVASGGGECCDAIQSQVTGLSNDVNTLKLQVSVITVKSKMLQKRRLPLLLCRRPTSFIEVHVRIRFRRGCNRRITKQKQKRQMRHNHAPFSTKTVCKLFSY